MIALLTLALIPLVAGWGVVLVKFLDQQQRDKQRKTYKLAFPADLDEERIVAWLRSVSGTLRGRSLRFAGSPTLAFEVWATPHGIEHRIKVPWQHAPFVIAQLRSHVPGLRYEEDTTRPHTLWTSAIEVGLSHGSRQLRIYSGADMATSLLASMQALEEGEVVMMQIVVTPTIPSHKPVYKQTKTDLHSIKSLRGDSLANRDEINDRRGKLEEPNMLGVLRIGAVAGSEARAGHLVARVKAALASARSPSTRFVRRLVGKRALQERLDKASAANVFPLQLSTRELSSLIAWPIDNPFVAGLPASRSRQLPVTENVAREGRVIGRSNFPGNERNIAVTHDDARKHFHVMGPTGVGKTVLLANMMKQDIAAGYGVILIENKGDLYNAALDYIPAGRIKDVIVLDVNDVQRPIGFNIMEQGDPRVVIDELGTLFEHLYDTKSVWTREVLYHGLRTLAAGKGLTFVDLAPLLIPMSVEDAEWREALLRGLKDQELRNFWKRFESQPRAAQDRIVQPVMDRIWQLNARPELRNIIGQSESSFKVTDVIRDNKILLVNLSGLPRESASLFGTLVMNSIWNAAKTTTSSQPSFLYLDEFQDFMNLPIDPEDMLAKARGFGLGMVLAHQHVDQLPNGMRSAVMANARSKVVFQTSSKDAAEMARQFGHMVSDADFMNLGKYEAITRVATGGSVSAPMTLTTNAPAKGFGKANQVLYANRQEYGRPVIEVEHQIQGRRSLENIPKRQRPRLQEGWGGAAPKQAD